MPGGFDIRQATSADREAAYWVCLKTGDHGADGEALFADDPDALGRIYVGPYLEFEPELALVLEDSEGICGYCLGAMDSRKLFERYEREWRPGLAKRYPEPGGDPSGWTPVEQVYHLYHHPDYFCPEPYDLYPSQLHIDLVPRAQGRGLGRRLVEEVVSRIEANGSPGVHLGMSARNERAHGFYLKLGFEELARDGTGENEAIYLGKRLNPAGDSA
ncbi:MAG: GNAT family N-acetyltransferase [Verrucomicrobiota bacterium]|nr:GNAT family N-acetyltransferase [Verrucomicrobiota bacterium]